MSDWTLKKTAGLVIGILTVVIILVGVFDHFFPGVREQITTTISSALDSLIGIDEQRAEATFDPNIKASVLNLKSTITQMQGSSRINCFANYELGTVSRDMHSGLAPLGDGDDQKAHLELLYNPVAQSTTFEVYGGSGGRQYLQDESFTINNFQPCVIAGIQRDDYGLTPAEFFYRVFIDQSTDQILVTDLHSVSNSYYRQFGPFVWTQHYMGNVLLYWDEGNTIGVDGWDFLEGFIRDEPNNLLDGGWLFKADNNHICFIPTVSLIFNNYNERGIDPNYISDASEDRSLAAQALAGTLPLCEPTQTLNRQSGEFGSEIEVVTTPVMVYSAAVPLHLTFKYSRLDGTWKGNQIVPHTLNWHDVNTVDLNAVYPEIREITAALRNKDEAQGYDYFASIMADVRAGTFYGVTEINGLPPRGGATVSW